jgi:phage protein U
MLIGAMGDVVFMASSLYTHTFDGFSRDSTARWAEHEIIGGKPVSEYLGPGTDRIRFKIHLSADLLSSPESAAKKIREMCCNGETFTVIIGGKPLSNELWCIESVGETKEYFDGQGNTLSATLDITLREYTLTSEIREV